MSANDGRSFSLPAVAAWWHTHSPRERRVMSALAVAVVLGLAWVLALAPLARTIERLRTQDPLAAAALARAEAKATATTSRTGGGTPAAGARHEQLASVLARQGLNAPGQQIAWDGDSVRLTLDGVPFATLVSVLATLHREAHLAVREAVISSRVEPGLVRADVTLGP